MIAKLKVTANDFMCIHNVEIKSHYCNRHFGCIKNKDGQSLKNFLEILKGIKSVANLMLENFSQIL